MTEELKPLSETNRALVERVRVIVYNWSNATEIVLKSAAELDRLLNAAREEGERGSVAAPVACGQEESPASSGGVSELGEAALNLMPYLRWQMSDESPGHHPTFPSAVAALLGGLEAAGYPREPLDAVAMYGAAWRSATSRLGEPHSLVEGFGSVGSQELPSPSLASGVCEPTGGAE